MTDNVYGYYRETVTAKYDYTSDNPDDLQFVVGGKHLQSVEYYVSIHHYGVL